MFKDSSYKHTYMDSASSILIFYHIQFEFTNMPSTGNFQFAFDKFISIEYGSGHGTAAVLLPGFAISW